jgi:hypothetical protein
MSLYKISEDFRNLMSQIDECEGEIDEQKEVLLVQLACAIENKVDCCVEWLRKLEAEADEASQRVKELKQIEEQKEKAIESYKLYLSRCMKMISKDKLKGSLHSMTLRKPSKKVEIIDENKIPMQFVEVKEVISISKTAIKKALDAGEIVEGAQLVDGVESLICK